MKIKVVSNYDSDENMYKTVPNCFENNTSLRLVMNDMLQDASASSSREEWEREITKEKCFEKYYNLIMES